MTAHLIKTLEREEIARVTEGKKIPDFAPGDTLRVNVKIKEGERERVQAFEGLCIARAGSGPQRELHRPQTLVRRRRRARVPGELADAGDRSKSAVSGKVRRAKLYYLRGLTGKRARIAEKTSTRGAGGSDEASES
jgi:large subunit ribosomal protein L19